MSKVRGGELFKIFSLKTHEWSARMWAYFQSFLFTHFINSPSPMRQGSQQKSYCVWRTQSRFFFFFFFFFFLFFFYTNNISPFFPHTHTPTSIRLFSMNVILISKRQPCLIHIVFNASPSFLYLNVTGMTSYRIYNPLSLFEIALQFSLNDVKKKIAIQFSLSFNKLHLQM